MRQDWKTAPRLVFYCDTVFLKDLVLEFWTTKVARTAKCKQKIFGTLTKLEMQGSTKKKKKYLTEKLSINSRNILLKASPGLYQHGKSGRQASLLEADVIAACDFFYLRSMYLKTSSQDAAL